MLNIRIAEKGNDIYFRYLLYAPRKQQLKLPLVICHHTSNRSYQYILCIIEHLFFLSIYFAYLHNALTTSYFKVQSERQKQGQKATILTPVTTSRRSFSTRIDRPSAEVWWEPRSTAPPEYQKMLRDGRSSNLLHYSADS